MMIIPMCIILAVLVFAFMCLACVRCTNVNDRLRQKIVDLRTVLHYHTDYIPKGSTAYACADSRSVHVFVTFETEKTTVTRHIKQFPIEDGDREYAMMLAEELCEMYNNN